MSIEVPQRAAEHTSGRLVALWARGGRITESRLPDRAPRLPRRLLVCDKGLEQLLKVALTSWKHTLQTLLLGCVDLEKDVKNLFQELEAVESQRNKEKEDFQEAKEDMD